MSKRLATTVVFEDDLHWNVECEHAGCHNWVSVAKRVGIPRDYHDESKGIEWTTITEPEARWCVNHPPFLEKG